VLDEYDSHLDETRCLQIEELIRTSGVPYVIRCTQQMETAARGNLLLVMEDGRVTLSGNPVQVFSSLVQTPFYPMSLRCKI
jgi:energy-coupling factor transport system ATP-binding protein